MAFDCQRQPRLALLALNAISSASAAVAKRWACMTRWSPATRAAMVAVLGAATTVSHPQRLLRLLPGKADCSRGTPVGDRPRERFSKAARACWEWKSSLAESPSLGTREPIQRGAITLPGRVISRRK